MSITLYGAAKVDTEKPDTTLWLWELLATLTIGKKLTTKMTAISLIVFSFYLYSQDTGSSTQVGRDSM
jgi:hypothetical protein